MTVAFQAPLSMGLPRQEYWSGLSFPSPGDFPEPGIKPYLLYCRWVVYPLSHQGSPWAIGQLWREWQFGILVRYTKSIQEWKRVMERRKEHPLIYSLALNPISQPHQSRAMASCIKAVTPRSPPGPLLINGYAEWLTQPGTCLSYSPHLWRPWAPFQWDH